MEVDRPGELREESAPRRVRGGARGDGRARGRSRAVAALCLALLLAGATAASAHHGEPATGEGEPGAIGSQNTGGTLSTDTELTPVGKDGTAAGWQQIAGSLWREDGTITDMARPGPGLDSPTPYDLDFYGLGFLKVEIAQNAGLSAAAASNEAKANGFAVGAQCRRSDPAQPVPAEDVAGCERVPVIYRYQDHPTKGLIWEQSYPDPDDKTKDSEGFVAAVAWLTPHRALAVGGTGTYPRREVERVPGEPDNAEGDAAYAKRDACQGLAPGEPCRGAGMARAWIFEKDPESADPKLRQGTWRELENKPDPEGGFTGEDGDEIPDEMRALHAIDASPRPADCLATLDGKLPQAECAIAGGMRQLWHFADGSFTRGYGPELNGGAGMTCTAPAGTTCTVASTLRFRVRDIRFAPQTWRIGDDRGVSVPAPAKPGSPSTYAHAVTSGCCSADPLNDRPAKLELDASGWTAVRGPAVGTIDLIGIGDRSKVLGDSGRFNPDSYYGLTVLRGRTSPGTPPDNSSASTLLRTPGGPAERYGFGEPPSRFGRHCDNEACTISKTFGAGVASGTSPDLNLAAAPAPGTTLSSLRLVSADGDLRGFSSTTPAASSRPDGLADWAVGVLRSSGRGVAYHTAFGANRHPQAYASKPDKCRGDEQLIPGEEDADSVCSVEAYQRNNASKALYMLSSYALNAYRVASATFRVQGLTGRSQVGDHLR